MKSESYYGFGVVCMAGLAASAAFCGLVAALASVGLWQPNCDPDWSSLVNYYTVLFSVTWAAFPLAGLLFGSLAAAVNKIWYQG